jgi:hypothetical protein
MDDKAAQLLGNQCNIDRHQNLLNSNLRATELRFVERRLSEGRFTLAMLQFTGIRSSATDIGLPSSPEAKL